MGEIVAKFGSSLSGFWWSLDDEERRIVIAAGAWLVAVALGALERQRKRTERQELVAEVVAELSGGGRG